MFVSRAFGQVICVALASSSLAASAEVAESIMSTFVMPREVASRIEVMSVVQEKLGTLPLSRIASASTNLENDIIRIIDLPQTQGSDGMPRKLVSPQQAQDIAAVYKVRTGRSLSLPEAMDYGNALTMEARIAGKDWRTKGNITILRRLTNPEACGTHGYLAEIDAYKVMLRRYPDVKMHFSSPNSRSADLVQILDGKVNGDAQVKALSTARGSLASGLSDLFMASAANPYKASVHKILLIPADQYRDLVARGVLTPDGKIAKPDRFVGQLTSEHRAAVNRGGLAASPLTNDGRLARLQKMHGLPAEEIAKTTVAKATIIPLDKEYSALRRESIQMAESYGPAANVIEHTARLRTSSSIQRGLAVNSASMRGGAGASLAIMAFLIARDGDSMLESLMSGASPSSELQAKFRTIQMAAAMGASSAAIVADAATLARMEGLARNSGKIAWVLLAVIEIVDVARYANGDMTSREFWSSQAGFVTGFAVGLATFQVCTVAGTAVCPGPGTMVGSAVGVVGGAFAGYYAARSAEQMVNAHYMKLDELQEEHVRDFLIDTYKRRAAFR